MANEFTLEQQQAIAIAEAERAKAESKNSASWSDVLKEAPAKAGAAIADEILNFPQNLYNVGKMAADLGKAAFGPGNVNVYGGQIPAESGQFDIPEDTVKNYLTEQNFIDPTLRGRMSPAQKMADTGIQAAVGGLAGGTLKQAVVGGISALAGQGVTEATGSEGAGLLTTLLAPLGGSKIKALNAERDAMAAKNATRDETLQGARDLGMVVVPEGKVANFAGRPEMIKTALEINQRRANEVAIRALGLPPQVKALSRNVLEQYKKAQYDAGYVPLKGLGQFTTSNDYVSNLLDIVDKYDNKSFGGAIPDAVNKLINRVNTPSFSAEDALKEIRELRSAASLNLASDKPKRLTLGAAQKDLASAIEDELERAAINAGAPPELIANYRAARKQIAIAHTIDSAMKGATGNVDLYKLGKMYDRGDYMEGDLLKAAKFGSLGKPQGQPANQSIPFQHFAGAMLASGAAASMGLPPGIGAAALAVGGGVLGHQGREAVAGSIRKAMMSDEGQRMLAPNYDALGIDPKAGALGGLMFEEANGGY